MIVNNVSLSNLSLMRLIWQSFDIQDKTMQYDNHKLSASLK